VDNLRHKLVLVSPTRGQSFNVSFWLIGSAETERILPAHRFREVDQGQASHLPHPSGSRVMPTQMHEWMTFPVSIATCHWSCEFALRQRNCRRAFSAVCPSKVDLYGRRSTAAAGTFATGMCPRTRNNTPGAVPVGGGACSMNTCRSLWSDVERHRDCDERRSVNNELLRLG
jgi:hypothetical protein